MKTYVDQTERRFLLPLPAKCEKEGNPKQLEVKLLAQKNGEKFLMIAGDYQTRLYKEELEAMLEIIKTEQVFR